MHLVTDTADYCWEYKSGGSQKNCVETVIQDSKKCYRSNNRCK